MVSAGERRAFLIGMTLNELVFLLFFLLLIISAVSLRSADRESREQDQQSDQLNQQLRRSQQQLDQAFKKLVLQEAVLSRLAQAGSGVDQAQLDAFFSRLVEDRQRAAQLQRSLAEQRRLEQRNRSLETSQRVLDAVQGQLTDAGLSGRPDTVIPGLIDSAREQREQTRTLQGRIGYLQRQLKVYQGTGVDHPPCWTDSNGGIEYLYHITIVESGLRIRRAWPDSRNRQAEQLPGALTMLDRTLSNAQFRQSARPLYDWSIAHECRHFVRVSDTPETSKQTFKQRLMTIEGYFYKLLERN